MAPKSSSFPGLWKYPTNRDIWAKSSVNWLEGRRQDDGADGLWRIDDHLYDFADFADAHPGGPDWLRLTKGTDITEAFVVHHLTSLPAAMLEKYRVRPATTRRNSPYTFKPDGFYNSLREEVLQEFPASTLRGPTRQSKAVCDVLAAAFLSLAALSAYAHSYVVAVAAGFFLSATVGAAHNFIHMRNHWRRFYLSLSMLSSTHFRIYHTLSHHLYPNSVLDLEVSLIEPWLPWLPRTDKGLLERYASWLISPIVYAVLFPSEYFRRVLSHGPDAPDDLLPWTVPLAMAAIDPAATLYLWPLIILSSSFFFSVTSINAGHHHPEVPHDGDAVRSDRDWGLAQLDCVVDRADLCGVSVAADTGRIDSSAAFGHFVLVLCNFGHHTLHHLFPTVDHFRLRALYPALERQLRRRGLRHRVGSSVGLVWAQFLQLARNTPIKEFDERTTVKTD